LAVRIDWEKIIMMKLYGNHPKSVKLWEPAKKVMNLFMEKEIFERADLAKELELKLDDSNDKKKFYNIISPMLDYIIVSSQDRKAGKTYYRISYDSQKAFLEGEKRFFYYKYGKWAKTA